MSGASYSGSPLDCTYQYITERPALQDDDDDDVDELDHEAEDVVYATDPEPTGELRSENVPVPETPTETPDVDGQSTLDDWGWSA